MFAGMQRWLVVGFGVLIGCGPGGSAADRAPTGGSATPPTATATATAAPDAPAVDSPGVTVLEPGSEPRTVLRHQLTAGTVTRLVVEVDLERRGSTGSGALPTLVLTADTEVERAGDAVKVTFHVVKVAVRMRAGASVPEAAVATQAALLEGAEVSATVLPDGTTQHVAVTLSARDAPPELAAAATQQLAVMEKLALRLPATPVGVGARWRYVATDGPMGMPVTLQTDVTITAIAGTRISYELTTHLRGADHHVQGDGMELVVSKLAGHGTGSGSFDLATWAQTSTLTQSLAFDMAAAGETAAAAMTQTVRIQGEQSAP